MKITGKSLGDQVMLAVLATCFGALLIASVIQYAVLWSSFRTRFQQDLIALADIVVNHSATEVEHGDAAGARQTLHALQSKPFIIHASIVLNNGATLALYGEPRNAADLQAAPRDGLRRDGPYFVLGRPILSRSKKATLYLWADYEAGLHQLERLYAGTLAVSLVVSLGLAFLVSMRLQRLVAAPLRALADTARKIAQHGDYSVRAAPARGEELGDLTRAFNQMLERIETQRAELAQAQERFFKAFQASPFAISLVRLAEDKVMDVNDAFLRMFGLERPEVPGRCQKDLYLWDEPQDRATFLRRLEADRRVSNFECRLRRRDGTVLKGLLQAELVELEGAPCLLIICEDVTQRYNLENQLRQAQKMEAVGQLAAGLSHDFNNILTVIEGNASFLKESVPPGTDEHDALGLMTEASQRAGGLVRQLLAFSRKQALLPAVLDLGEVVRHFRPMLQRVLHSRIRFNVCDSTALPPIRADRGMIEQVLMNLIINARDAMPLGGSLRLNLEEVTLSPKATEGHPEARPGRFICLTVADAGCGMDTETMRRAFEPFYTTKEPGQGTGLGLATTYGIVKQHDGWIELNSQPGRGTTFRLYFPVAEGPPADAAAAETPPAPSAPVPAPAPAPPPPATILVAEDDPAIRCIARIMLERAGYRVLEAANGQEALRLWELEGPKVDLLFTDMIMPGGITGQALAERLTASRPDLKVLCSSAYTSEVVTGNLLQNPNIGFLPKPYSPAALVEAVRAALNPEANADKGPPPTDPEPGTTHHEHSPLTTHRSTPNPEP